MRPLGSAFLLIALWLPPTATAETVVIDSDTTIFGTVGQPEEYTELSIQDQDGARPTVVTILDTGRVEGYVYTYDSSVLNVHGGEIAGRLRLCERSLVNITGGVIGRDMAPGSRLVVVSVDGIRCAEGWPTCNISGGEVNGWASSYRGTLSISGGAIRGDVVTYFEGIVNFSGGSVLQSIRVDGNGMLTMTGGTVGGSLDVGGGGLDVADTAHLYGGVIEGPLLAGYNGSIHVWGYDLDLTDELLTGTLADGTPLSHEAITEDNGRFILHEVPEPSVLAGLLGLVLVGLAGAHKLG